MENKKVYQKKLLYWLAIIFLLLSLPLIIGVSIFTYQKESQNSSKRQQEIAKLETQLEEIQEFRDQVQQAYELQNFHLTSAVELADKPAVHSFFTDLLTTYAEKFAKNKGLDTSLPLQSKDKGLCSQLPFQFEGFHLDPNTGNGLGSMGRCSIEDIIYPTSQKLAHISLNQLYLLNKFRLDRFFTTPQGEYIDISFKRMLETCSHELAHYIQFVKWGKSSCESDLVLRKGDYDPLLAKEHKEFSKEIYQLIKKDFLNLEVKWREI